MSDTDQRIDHIAVGVIVAFDPDTGDALHVHEEYSEVVDGAACSTEFTQDDVERVRAEAVERYPRRRIDVVTAPPEVTGAQRSNLGDPGFASYRVDPMTRKIRREPETNVELLQAKLHAAGPFDRL